MLAAGVLGLALAVAATGRLNGLLFEIDAFDPLTFPGMPFVLSVAAPLAAQLPARCASRVNPIAALRVD